MVGYWSQKWSLDYPKWSDIVPRHFGYRKEVGEILKTALGKFKRTPIPINKLATAFAIAKKNQMKFSRYLGT